MDITEIRTDLIDEDPGQPRYQFDEEALEELMRSIEELGLLSPIKVRQGKGGRYIIIYGNRRYLACKRLGKPAIPCIVSTATDEVEIYLEQVAENLTREGFSPIEEAEAFHKLLNDARFNSSTKFLASKLGKPESYIKNKCELLKFGPAVRKLIVSGTEIRKDKLTEDQLLPLKDLPLEHRDPLALITARDELPVTDVKKIAQLFKDKDISPGTKDKLLYKSGRELIETWSVFRQNRAEREKAAAEAAERAAAKAAAEAAKAAEAAAGAAGEGAAGTAGEGAAGAAVPVRKPAPVEARLQKLLAALPAAASGAAEAEAAPGSAAAADAVAAVPAERREMFAAGVDELIAALERQLEEWRAIRSSAQQQE